MEYHKFITNRDADLVLIDSDNIDARLNSRIDEQQKHVDKARVHLKEFRAQYQDNPLRIELQALLAKIDNPVTKGDAVKREQALADAGLTWEQYHKLCEEYASLERVVIDQEMHVRSLEGKLEDLLLDRGNEAQFLSLLSGKREGFRIGIRAMLSLMAALIDDAHANTIIYRLCKDSDSGEVSSNPSPTRDPLEGLFRWGDELRESTNITPQEIDKALDKVRRERGE